jgi:hypothetical protein
MRRPTGLLVAVLAVGTVADAQTARPPQRRPAAPPPPATVKAPPEMTCPAPLGTGIQTNRQYCDVLSTRSPAEGVRIVLPPHRGDVTLTFTLHNRHTYSEEQVKAKRAFARYSAVIGVMTMDNTLISRAAVQSEFRNASDLVERIDGGAGPSGVKAVAPSGSEPIRVVVPEAENEVSLLGEKLIVDTVDGSATYSSPGRPIAVVSDVMIEYRPGPPPRAPRKR